LTSLYYEGKIGQPEMQRAMFNGFSEEDKESIANGIREDSKTYFMDNQFLNVSSSNSIAIETTIYWPVLT